MAVGDNPKMGIPGRMPERVAIEAAQTLAGRPWVAELDHM
jgi:hypothetical protein